jgi:hypothetical protein
MKCLMRFTRLVGPFAVVGAPGLQASTFIRRPRSTMNRWAVALIAKAPPVCVRGTPRTLDICAQCAHT